MKVVNGTNEAIRIFDVKDCELSDRKLVLQPGAKPIVEIPAEKELKYQKGRSTLRSDLAGSGLPLQEAIVFTGHDPIPDADLVIVSELYRNAVKELGGDTSRLASISRGVYDSPGSMVPFGCIGLAVG